MCACGCCSLRLHVRAFRLQEEPVSSTTTEDSSSSRGGSSSSSKRSASEKEVARATASEKEEGRKDHRPRGQGMINSFYDECVHVDSTSIDCFRADDGAVAQQLAELRGLLKKQV